MCDVSIHQLLIIINNNTVSQRESVRLLDKEEKVAPASAAAIPESNIQPIDGICCTG